MKNRMIPLQAFLLLFLLYASTGHAQSPGLIVRPAGNGYSSVLDTNTNGFTSPTSSGFATSDVGPGYSEIAYKKIMPFKLEPVSDLRRGPNELFSDLVRTVDSSGFYVYNDGVNLLFRLRLGSIVSGSKGYSVMIDTDMKFGPVDTNYRAATTGVNGNPGFELEVVLETNFRVAVYNVDGTSTPALLTSFPIGTHSQISVALSRVSNTPDYFYDFYVPMSVLPGVTATTPLRMIATTVMSPQAATGGPKSDIYGINDSECPDPNKCLEEAVNLMPPFTPNDVRSSGPGTGAICTASPVMNVPISTGSVTISGTWTRADASKPSTAKVVLYRNGTPIDSGTYASGAAWSFANVTSSLNDVFYARAQAVGESSCSPSNSYKVIGCTNLTPVSRISITCATQRGFNGKRPVGAA
ncbi:MAG TPA: hypothetical protein VHK69_10935, partial [Chitinophagaceae bacterium]|nr:hypothetical protein [Chitinophagaceae bacterium]